MPVQKRSPPPENLTDNNDEQESTLVHCHQREQEFDDVKEEEDKEEEEDEDETDRDDEVDDSDDESPSSSTDDIPEFVLVQLPDIRKDVHCPICLGIIKKTRTVMECLHRFCRECIDKSMRMGNNECPACRTHCASRRSLRDDPNYDALIATLYPDIEKYEEEELAFHEEERTRNEQIQASIVQIFQRQSEALTKRRSLGKDTQDTYVMRPQRNTRNAYQRKRNSRATELQGFEYNEDENEPSNMGTKSPSAEERYTEERPKRPRGRAGSRSSLPSSSVANSDGRSTENVIEVSRENRVISPGLVWSSEMLAWGRGGARSHTRHGIASGCKNFRSTRLSKLVDYLRSLKENIDEVDVHLMLVSLDKRCIPSLKQPHLSCRPSLSVKQLYEYVACQTPLQAEEVELFVVKGHHSSNDEKLSECPTALMSHVDSISLLIDPCRYELQILQAEETLAGIANGTPSRDHMIIAYKRKEI